MSNETKNKKKMSDYGYKMYSLPEKVMSAVKTLSLRDQKTYGELITDALESYITRYPSKRVSSQVKIDSLMESIVSKSKVSLDIQ